VNFTFTFNIYLHPHPTTPLLTPFLYQKHFPPATSSFTLKKDVASSSVTLVPVYSDAWR